MNPPNDSVSASRVSPATVGCIVLVVAFFLPWIKFLGSNVGGHQLHNLWNAGPYVWAIPGLAVIAIAIGLSGKDNTKLAQVAGSVPFIFLAFALYRFGADLMKHLLIGGYLTLIAGLFLLLVAPRLKTAKRSSGGESESNPGNASP